MAVESSRGLGQGAAQVFDTSVLANQYAQQEDAKAKAKYTQQKDLEKKIAEVSGGLNDIFKEKIFATRDRDAIQKLYDDSLKKFEGRWHLVADPSSPEAREWAKTKQDVYLAAQQSYETRQLLDDANKNIDDYTPETKQYLTEVYNTPLTILDPTKLKKINTFDPDKWFQTEVQAPFFKEVEVQNQKDIGFNDKGDYVVTGTKTVAPEEQIDKRVEVMLQNIYSDDKKLDKFIDKYSTELEGLNRQEQLDKLPDLINRDYRGRLKYNKSDINYSKNSDGGKQEPFNPANIVDNFDLKTNTGQMEWIKGWKFSPKVKNQKTPMYQTGKVTAVIPISKGVIDMDNDKEFSETGTYSVEMGSPLVYGDKLMVPAIVKGIKADGGGEYHQSVLIPAEDVQQQFLEQEGTDLSQVANQFKVPFGGKTTTTTTNKSTTGSYNIKGKSYSLAELKGMGYTEEQVSQFKTK